MARLYAGILGLLASLTCLARGVVHGSDAEPTVLGAWLGLMLFSAIGYVIGWVAERTVAEAVSNRIARELAAEDGAAEPKSAASAA